MKTTLLSTGIGIGLDSTSRWGALRGDTQTRNEKGQKRKKKSFSLWSAVNGRPHTQFRCGRSGCRGGCSGSGVRCSGAMVGFAVVVVTVHKFETAGRRKRKVKRKKKKFGARNQGIQPRASPHCAFRRRDRACRGLGACALG